MSGFDPKNWYWFVNSDATRVFASASGGFVPTSDPTFIAWQAAGGSAGAIDSGSLGGVLALYGVRPVDAGILAAYQQALAAVLDEVVLRMLFNHENRIRTQAAQPTITRQQFIAAVAAMM